MLYKKVRLGITLCTVPIILALLTLDWSKVPWMLYRTIDPFNQNGLIALLVIIATFNISWFSYLYKDTKMIQVLSEGLRALVKRRRITLSLLPALMGLLPVPGGALLSAPMVEAEAKDLGLSPEKMAYINLWFRHIIFPIYPLSQSLIVAAALTGIPLFTILLLQIPVIAAMTIIGYLVGLRSVPTLEVKERRSEPAPTPAFVGSLLPILSSMVIAILLGIIDNELFQQGLNVVIASFTGLVMLAALSRVSLKTFVKPLFNLWIYDVTFATYGAFLFQNVTKAISAEVFGPWAQSGILGAAWLLTAIPLLLGIFIGSPMGAIAITVSIFPSFFTFSPKSAALLYAFAYLGYIVAPTHLCFIFTVDYFKTTLAKVYKYLVPSFIITCVVAAFLYL